MKKTLVAIIASLLTVSAIQAGTFTYTWNPRQAQYSPRVKPPKVPVGSFTVDESVVKTGIVNYTSVTNFRFVEFLPWTYSYSLNAGTMQVDPVTGQFLGGDLHCVCSYTSQFGGITLYPTTAWIDAINGGTQGTWSVTYTP